jgi:hypothetical protein
VGTGLNGPSEGCFGLPAADASGQAKPGDAAVFSNQFGEPLRYFERGWRSARTRANITDLNRDAG